MARKRALIVDDSKTARIVMTKRLSEQELEVDSVESAGQAIDNPRCFRTLTIASPTCGWKPSTRH